MKKSLLTVLAAGAFALTGFAQQYIPTAGFETWGSSFGEDQQPQNWISYNVFTAPVFDPGGTNPTSVTPAPTPDNYQGAYSAKIVTVDLVTNQSPTTIPNRAGLLMIGSISFTSPYLHPGYLFGSRPATLTYYSKYTPVNGDTAYCLVLLTHWNSSNSTRDTVATGLDWTNTSTTSYAQRTVALVYNPNDANVTPDTCTIVISASSNYTPQAGSTLYVDALSFSGFVGINEQDHAPNPVNVYPNPSNTVTNFDVTSEDAYEVVVYDMTGREVKREQIMNKKGTIDSSTMDNGMYSYHIIAKSGDVLSSGQFAVSR
ncbi:MAG TPA: T9SS type A sorting domain-containing protein [Bacteroidia bacterium]|nr:T9SS type A sorting domain-containing protein [Bacteroidia bacterium]